MIAKTKSLFVLLLLSLALAACGPSAEELDALSTQAAATVVAGFTATAQALPTETPLPPATETPAPTEVPPTETPAATNTPEPTVTPSLTPTSTLPSGDPRLTLGDPDWISTFDERNWFLYEDDHIKMDIVDQKLVLTAFLPESWEGWSTTGFRLEDFYLEITGTTGSECSGKDRYGMIVRASQPNEGYLFGISCDGFFRLRSWDGETFVTLVNWTASDLINTGPGQTNRVGLMARGEELRMYINGVEAGVIEDDTFDRGAFGIFVSSAATEDFTVTVSDVRYWNLP